MLACSCLLCSAIARKAKRVLWTFITVGKHVSSCRCLHQMKRKNKNICNNIMYHCNFVFQKISIICKIIKLHICLRNEYNGRIRFDENNDSITFPISSRFYINLVFFSDVKNYLFELLLKKCFELQNYLFSGLNISLLNIITNIIRTRLS